VEYAACAKESTNQSKFKKDVSVHVIRYSYATHLIQSGIDLLTVQNLFYDVSSVVIIYVFI